METKPLRILFIKKREDALDQVEKHLIKRGYHVVSVVQLKMAVLKALEIKAEFVLIPMDHPNLSVKQLPQVFAQLLRCHVIPYIESHSASAILDIRRQGLKYNLLPPLLGPKVERMINRIVFDQKALDEIDSRRNEIQQRVSLGSDVIKVKGGQDSSTLISEPQNLNLNSKAQSSNLVSSSDGLNLKSDLKLSIDSSSLNSIYNEYVKTEQSRTQATPAGDVGRKQRTTDFFVSFLKKTSEVDIPPAWKQNENESNDLYHLRLRNSLTLAQERQQPSNTKNMFFEKVELRAMENCLHRLQTSGIELNEDVNYEPSQLDIHRALAEMSQVKGAPEEFMRRPHELPQVHLDRMNEALKSYQLESKILAQFSKFQSQAEAGSELGILNPNVNKVLDEATYKALLKVHDRSNLKDTEHLIQNTSRMTCLVVENEKNKGYIVITTAKDMILSEAFQIGVFQEFQSALLEKGIQFEQKDIHQLEVQAVPFIDWVSKRANFLKKSSFEGEEVGLAFFPVESFKPEFSPSSVGQLWQVKISELRTRVKMDFDLYLNLPLNEKLLLYVPKGFDGVEKQLDRLHKKGVEMMYVKPEALPAVQKYQAQNFIEDQIDLYQGESGPVRVRMVGQ